MDASRADLLAQLEAYYRGCGWTVQRVNDSTLHADGPGGITWIGLAVVGEDVHDDPLDALDYATFKILTWSAIRKSLHVTERSGCRGVDDFLHEERRETRIQVAE